MSKKRQRRNAPPPLRRPETREIAVAQVSDEYSDYPSNGLNPIRLAEIFREADAGDVLRQVELFEDIEEKDPHLFSQLQTRKNAVTGLDFEIIPFGDEPRDKEIADFIAEQLESIESFEEVETDLLDAIGKGFAVSEILWGFEGTRVGVRPSLTVRLVLRCHSLAGIADVHHSRGRLPFFLTWGSVGLGANRRGTVFA